MTQKQKIITIIGGIAVFVTTVLTIVAYFITGSQQKDLNRKRTEAARSNRWAKTAQDVEIVNETEDEEQQSKQDPDGDSHRNDVGATS